MLGLNAFMWFEFGKGSLGVCMCEYVCAQSIHFWLNENLVLDFYDFIILHDVT